MGSIRREHSRQTPGMQRSNPSAHGPEIPLASELSLLWAQSTEGTKQARGTSGLGRVGRAVENPGDFPAPAKHHWKVGLRGSPRTPPPLPGMASLHYTHLGLTIGTSWSGAMCQDTGSPTGLGHDRTCWGWTVVHNTLPPKEEHHEPLLAAVVDSKDTWQGAERHETGQ